MTGMTFVWPTVLISLAVLPVLVLLYVSIQHRRRKILEKLGGLGLPQRSNPSVAIMRGYIPTLLFLAGLALLLIAMARPQTEVSLPKIESTIILAFDVSGSMGAEDFQPNRMEAAKLAARGFIDSQPAAVLIGVVAFSDGGFNVQVPTDDRQSILDTIDRLKPTGGTSLANGIVVSLNMISSSLEGKTTVYGSMVTPTIPTPTPVPAGTHLPAAIILLSDGENTSDSDPLKAALAAADRGVRIYTVGIGSPAGIDLEVEGFLVHTTLDEPTLKQIAAVTGGSYFNAQTEEDLENIYSQIKPELIIKTEKMEVTSFFAAAGMFIFLIAGLYSLFWFSRLP
jgi:Ca-activated chloride channel family protein